MSVHAQETPQPLGGLFLTPAVKVLGAIAGVGILAILARFVFGLGAVTALNDGYPWGLWIAFDVVTGTALACGGYAIALLVFILNKGEYHPLVRPALVTSAFGYTIAGVSVFIDIGRYWAIWKVPVLFWHWNLDSVLLEVALCIMAYMLVAWIELSPAFFERGLQAPWPRLRSFSASALKTLRKALVWIVALGILLPTMHQSSLGSLLLLSGPRLHPLWNTLWLPLLFLISCIAMGFAAVVLEGALSAAAFGRQPEREMLAGLGAVMVPVLAVYLALRLADLVVRGQLAALFAFDRYSILSLIELALFAAPIAMLATERRRRNFANLFRAAMMLAIAGGLYRFDVFLVAFNPGDHWSYFPSVAETLATLGLVAIEVLGYIALVRFFPILGGMPAPAPHVAG
jgi:Ni/Fe-hydrogenase subunit HybB-like protein